MLRVLESTIELIAVTFPLNTRSARASVVTCTSKPGVNWPRYCWGKAKSAKSESSEVSCTTCWPELIICPTFTWRIPSWPSNGAIIVFFRILERIWSTTAFSLLNFDCAASSSAFESTFCDARPRVRSKSCRASSASASADRKSASSADASSWTNKSPFLAVLPFSKAIWLTTPPSSLETTAPWTAEIEPTADNVGAQSSSFTVALDTVVGGISIGVDIILPICSALIPTMITTRAIKPPTATPIVLSFDFICVLTGLAISCISDFCLWFEQQAPEPTCHFELSLAPFRSGHLLGAQYIEHQHSACHCEN